ncbi:3,4-dihydroxy-2-butanone-4-phosphate synthase [Staphylococcus auricularis]|uniref:3,4-dihydroxy-2-butanone-4-phosphate synthase n=1 Tax=Staphylococcus auricularis TaxID=29379 RepID=UPI001BCAC1A7|nr:3,4-dihydroxy-2-butanone-4-phosphate synthase [Staphylococcus auricularis]
MQFDHIETAIETLKQGELVIVVDDEDRENEGDLVAVTEFMKDDAINFMAKYGRGLICAPISRAIATQLQLSPMIEHNTDAYGTCFTVSVDHKATTTGISAHERTLTARQLIEPTSTSDDFHKPGHLFPLIAYDDGVLARTGHTEASVDLAKLAGTKPAAVICEIMNDDGTMAKGEDLQRFKETHQLPMITIEDLVKYRQTHEKELEEGQARTSTIEAKAKVKMPTEFGQFDMYGFTSRQNGNEIVAIVKGPIEETANVRIHSSCLTGDIFHSERCDCGEQLHAALKYINKHGGMVIYLPQEGRGIGLINKLKAYELIEQGYDTVTANHALGFKDDLREYHEAVDILKYFGVKHVNLLSNNPRKFEGLTQEGIDINQRIELIVPVNEHSAHYMTTKKEKMGHLI